MAPHPSPHSQCRDRPADRSARRPREGDRCRALCSRPAGEESVACGHGDQHDRVRPRRTDRRRCGEAHARRRARHDAQRTRRSCRKDGKGGRGAARRPRDDAAAGRPRCSTSASPIAVVVADTLEQAKAGADAVRVAYAADRAVLDFDAAKSSAHPPKKMNTGSGRHQRRRPDGRDAERHRRRWTRRFTTPMVHHNPIEPHATIAAWEDDHLTIYDSTQSISGDQKVVSKTLGIDPKHVPRRLSFRRRRLRLQGLDLVARRARRDGRESGEPSGQAGARSHADVGAGRRDGR